MADPKIALSKVVTALVNLQVAGIRNLPKPTIVPEVKPLESTETEKHSS